MASSRTDGTEAAGAGALAHGGAPIDMGAIDRVLEDSAGLGGSTPGHGVPHPVREWREDLAVALAALAYAREILAADIAILHRCLAVVSGEVGSDVLDDLVSDLSGLLTTPPGSGSHGELAQPEDAGAGVPDIAQVVARSDVLVTAHRDMARTDLASPAALSRTLLAVETQLTAVAERQGAVVARLQELRAVVIRQYAERSRHHGSSLDTPA